jgi:hypothetical protein
MMHDNDDDNERRMEVDAIVKTKMQRLKTMLLVMLTCDAYILYMM